jgi:Molybdopterin-binding domain of aldehyde dehydrogenase
VPVKVDEDSVKWEKGFIGVVADKEWDAIKAAQKLRVEWSDVKPPFPDPAALYDHIRKAPVRKREVIAEADGLGGDLVVVHNKETGNVDEAFRNAARMIEAEYQWPFQSHASMGPACAIVEVKDGQATVGSRGAWRRPIAPRLIADSLGPTDYESGVRSSNLFGRATSVQNWERQNPPFLRLKRRRAIGLNGNRSSSQMRGQSIPAAYRFNCIQTGNALAIF